MNNLVLSEIKAMPGNNRCADCGLTNPDWASISFGTLFCLECSGVHRSLGVHISFVRSLAMDSWSPKQIAIMKAGGNNKCQAYLSSKGIPANTLIKDKYDSEVAQNYKEVLKARSEGRDDPIFFPKETGFMSKEETLLTRINNDEYVMKKLRKETEQKSYILQTYEKEDAHFHTSEKSREDKIRGKIQGIGSSNPYENDALIELGYIKNSISHGLGSVWKTMGNITAKAESVFSQEGNIRELSGKVKSTGMEFWKSVKNLTQKTAMTLVEPEDNSGLCELQKRVHAEKNLLNSSRTIYEGIGYDNLVRKPYINPKKNSNKMNSTVKMVKDSNITSSLTEETHHGFDNERDIKTNKEKNLFEANDGIINDTSGSNLLTYKSVQDKTPRFVSSSNITSKISQNNMVLKNIHNEDFFSNFNT